ncbi:hypothetical protein PVAND_016929 [Polypedilum vanderplanki]|uniref:non-specific serine/threonine protein kinase n=1 Tax=Polypedilum vanderplanki TaxID=319348 RepID=A0A9J6BHM4_POLVA|nr:hypothetical protein PVAND_016929 [Polypedilum vanderplanki]
MEKFESFSIQNYKILHLIGTGSFGKVFKAFDNETQNVVALKVLSKNGRSTKELSALKQEANIQQNLRHPNIIQLFSSFETDKELVFVCEYAVSDLHKLLAKVGSLGEQRTQKLSYDLISALYYLHSHRILHRDLKPPNILLDKNYKAKVCDFGLARNMTIGTQILTSIKGTPLYMAPELLDGRGYGHEADLWSLGCIIYEMLAGESPFNTRSILHLMQLIRYGNIKWPSFLSSTCISFLKGLLDNNPTKRMSWDEILDHKFVKGNILILTTDKSISDSPFTRPKNAAKTDPLPSVNQQRRIEVQQIEDIASSRDSIKVNLNLQSDMDETDNETELNILKQEPIAIGQIPFQHDFNQFQMDLQPKIQPLAENANMVMHRFMDNVDPELQQFLMMPLVTTATNSMKTVQKSEIRRSIKIQSDHVSTDVSSIPVETEEWLQFIFKSMQEILDGDLDIYKQENMMTMIVGLLRDSKYSPQLIEHAVQIISLPYAIDMPQSMIEEIDRMYLQLKLVPNLVYASKLLCSKNSTGEFNEQEMKTLAGIYDVVVFLVYASETFLQLLCDAMALLNLDHLFRNFIINGLEKETKEAVRLTGSILALICAILQELPENAKLIEKIIFHDDVDLCKLLRHKNDKIRLRVCIMLRLLGRFCCYALQSYWNVEISNVIQKELINDENNDVKNAANNILEEFKCFGWFKK